MNSAAGEVRPDARGPGGDPRWDAEVIETDDLSPSEVAGAVEKWVQWELATRAHR